MAQPSLGFTPSLGSTPGPFERTQGAQWLECSSHRIFTWSFFFFFRTGIRFRIPEANSKFTILTLKTGKLPQGNSHCNHPFSAAMLVERTNSPPNQKSKNVVGQASEIRPALRFFCDLVNQQRMSHTLSKALAKPTSGWRSYSDLEKSPGAFGRFGGFPQQP